MGQEITENKREAPMIGDMNLLHYLKWMNVWGYNDLSASSTISQDAIPISEIPKKMRQQLSKNY